MLCSISRIVFLVIYSTFALSFEQDTTLPRGFINNLEANYQSPTGRGHATAVSLAGFGNYESPNFEVDNAGGVLIFTVEDNSFEIDLSSLSGKDVDRLSIQAMNYIYNQEKLQASFNSFSANSQDFASQVNHLQLSCLKSKDLSNPLDDLLISCLSQAGLRVQRLNFRGSSAIFSDLVENSFTTEEVEIEKLEVSVNNSRLKAKFKGNISKGITVKIEGSTSYSTTDKKITLRIDKAKAGFINIRNNLFDEFKKMENENIEVRKPYIFITIPEETELY